MRRRGSTTRASSRSRSRSNSVGSSRDSLPGTTENGLETKKRRRSREEMARVDGGRGGCAPNAWLDRCGDTAANCGNWRPALVSGVVGDTTTSSSSTGRGRRGRMSAPAVLESTHSGAKSSFSEEVDSDDHTSEKEDDEVNEDGGDDAAEDDEDNEDGGDGTVEDDSDADDGEDARSAWESACHGNKGRRIMDLPRFSLRWRSTPAAVPARSGC